MKILFLLLILMSLAGLWAVMTSLLLRAAIALALTSAILTIIMFRLGAPLAGVFELSVCAGLISVVFISVISLTHRLPLQEYLKRRESRISRFIYLPFILLAAILVISFIHKPILVTLPAMGTITEVRSVMWDVRRLDLFGQIMVLLAGVYGVLILFKGRQ
jgi:NADH-quinone oxidoreductase subunit J